MSEKKMRELQNKIHEEAFLKKQNNVNFTIVMLFR